MFPNAQSREGNEHGSLPDFLIPHYIYCVKLF